jgi:N,N'-diacetylchitobiose phosphorylase
MQYGHFDDPNKEYLITHPDTPRSWSNYLGDTTYGAIITNNAGGYSFYRSAAVGRFLRLRFNAVPLDQPGRYFYLRDAETGDFWSSSWQPVGKSLDEYQSTCRHGTAYTIISSEYSGIATEATYFVPLGQRFEYWRLKVHNTGDTPRKLSIFTYCEFASEWNAIQDLINLQYSGYIVRTDLEDGILSCSSLGHLPEDPANFANGDQSRWSWMAMPANELSGYDTSRERFLGAYGTYARPEVVTTGQTSQSLAHGDSACGGLRTELILAPGESKDVLVMLGVGRARSEGRAALAEYGSTARLEEELEKLREHWHAKLGHFTVETPDEAFNSMINVWNAYNALITFAWSRTASLVYNGERDGLGYRDTVQDILGVLHAIPGEARQRLELMITGQESTGGAKPVVRPFDHRPGQMPLTPPHEYRSDDCLWLFCTIPAYVAETGDRDFYTKVLPYSDEGEDTVLGHLRRALEFNLRQCGSHGLPCGLLADWNDCLKLGFHGESIFVTFQLRHGLATYAAIAEELGQQTETAWARETLENLDAAIAKYTWDGDWFVRGFCENGEVLGSSTNREGSLFLNPQSWAVMSGTASGDQSARAMQAVHDRLATPFGLKLCDPPYVGTPHAVVRAVLFNEGQKENGGIFCHTQGWAVIAETMLGHGDRAFQYYRAYMPAAYNERAEVRQSEPYVHCQSTHGPDSRQFGASRLPWLSGTAAWAYHAATQYILGIRPEGDGLRIDPCLPSTWPTVTIHRNFRGLRLTITISNPDRRQKGLSRLTLDGIPQNGNFVSAGALRDGSHIEATLG